MRQITAHNLTLLLSIAISGGLLLLPIPAYANNEEVNQVFYWLVNAVAHITALAGTLLNFAVYYLVINMGTIVDNSLGEVINKTWTIIRDLLNIGFIFALIYIGFLVIYDAGSNSAKKLLAPLIIAALLINFSLFFTKVLIDISNVAAIEIYQAMPSVDNPRVANQDGESSEINANYGISGYAAERMGITDVVVQGAIEKDTGASIAYFFSSLIFLAIAFVVFIAGAVLLVIRFVALIFIMIFSPLLFAGMIFPKAQSITSQWISYALRYAFFAPAYFLMLYISFRILGDQDSVGVVRQDDGSLLKAIQGEEGVLSVILEFTIVCGFMIGSLILAQKMGIAGSNSFVNFTKAAGTKVRGSIQGTIGRNTIGRLSRGLQKGYDRYEARGGWGSRTLHFTGAGQVIRDVYDSGAKAKFGSSQSRLDVENYDDSREKAWARAGALNNATEAIQNFTDYDGSDPVEQEERKIKMEEALADLSGSQLVDIMKDGSKREILMDISGNLSSSQADAIFKSDDLTDDVKGKFGAARATSIENRLIETHGAGPGATISDVIPKASASELESVGYQTVLDNAGLLTSKQLDDFKNFTPTQITRIKADRKRDIINGGVMAAFDHFSEQEFAKLPKEILTDPAALPLLSTNILSKIPDNDNLDASDRAALKASLLAAYPVGTDRGDQLRGFFSTGLGTRF